MAKFANKCFAVIILKNVMILKKDYASILAFTAVIILPFIGLATYLSLSGSLPRWMPSGTPEPMDQRDLFNKLFEKRIFLAYSPKNNFTDLIMAHTISYLSRNFSNADIKLLPSTSENNMIHLLEEEATGKYEDASQVGIVFYVPLEKNFTSHLKYKIRTRTFPIIERSPSSDIPGRLNSQAPYITGEFMFFQLTINQVFIDMIRGKHHSNIMHDSEKVVTFNIKIQEFPYPASTDNKMYLTLMLIKLGIALSLINPANLLHTIMTEKKTGVKELMKMRGINDCILWSSWQMYVFIVNIIPVTFITGFIKLGPTFAGMPLPSTDVTVLWLFLMLQEISTASFFYFIAMLFVSPMIAYLAGIALWTTLGNIASNNKFASPVAFMLAIVIGPLSTVDYGMNIIVYVEFQGVGVQWNNLFENVLGDAQGLSMGLLLSALVISSAFYYTLSWYVGSIKPGPYGRTKPWYFIFHVCAANDSVKPNMSPVNTDERAELYDKVPNNLNVAISIQNLRKTFNRGSLVAVDNVTMDIYEGTITAFVGHNGAGKTTLMNMITGMFSPTSGKIYFNAKNIFSNIQKFRYTLGFCPQQNLLFPELNCIQHLIIFGMIQGLSYSKANAAGRNILQKFNMTDKKNTLAKDLSGGMKRKLSLAISVTGEPKVITLDEPTSGLDPESRREVWDILLGYRGNRTILITTHLLDEADVLADRIAIMDHGRVHCYGTPLFLKRVYGSGFNYKLTVLKSDAKSMSAVTSFVSSAVPGAGVNAETSTVVTYSLPSALAKNFPALFKQLEEDTNGPRITGISIAFTSMEDVFIRVAKKVNPIGDENNIPFASQIPERNVTKQSGIGLFIGRFKALLVKRIICSCRSHCILICCILATLYCTWYSAVLLLSLEPESFRYQRPPLVLRLSSYHPSTVLFKADDDVKVDIYQNLINEQGSKPVRVRTDIAVRLAELCEADAGKYMKHYLVAAQFDEHTAKSLYSSVHSHTAPISLNLLSNTLCKAENSNCTITTANHPLTDVNFLCQGNVNFVAAISSDISVWFGIGLLVQVAQCITVPFSERVNNVKQLQIKTGVGSLTYWLTFWLYDYTLIVATLFCMLSPIIYFSTGISNSQPNGFGEITLLIILYLASEIWCAYFFSNFKKSSTECFVSFLTWNIAASFPVLYVPLITNEFVKNACMITCSANAHCTAFYALNSYVKTFLIRKFCRMCPSTAAMQRFCKEHDIVQTYTYYPFDTINPLTILALDTLLYASIHLLWDRGIFYICAIRCSVERNSSVDEDSDVIQEQINISEARSYTDESRKHLIVDGLAKKNWNYIAVRNVSFTVAAGECFGLLGTNGAGKTTAFRMLTGDTRPNRGDAVILQHSLVKHRGKYLSHIGYCPQDGGIIDTLTGEELLTLFACLRGLRSNEVHLNVKYWLNVLGLNEFRKCLSGNYSDGNKRKLSTAIALIGDPAVVFLDEPTSGVDPVSRRNLWSALARVQNAGQAIVLTSHNMEECEALCNRLTIMVGGSMKCIGNMQYLKQKYGLSFTIVIKVSSDPAQLAALDQLKRAVLATFGPKSNLKGEHTGMLHYHIADPDLSWAKLYGGMDELMETNLLVEDFSISDTTLEQVFIEFAQQDKNVVVNTNL